MLNLKFYTTFQFASLFCGLNTRAGFPVSKVSHVSVSLPSIPALLILPTFLTSLAVFVSPVVQHCFMGVAPETLRVICLCPHGCVCVRTADVANCSLELQQMFVCGWKERLTEMTHQREENTHKNLNTFTLQRACNGGGWLSWRRKRRQQAGWGMADAEKWRMCDLWQGQWAEEPLLLFFLAPA